MKIKHLGHSIAALLIAVGVMAFHTVFVPHTNAADTDWQGERDQLVKDGLRFLETKGQAEDGSFSGEVGPGVTALVATAAMRSGRPPEDPMVAKSLNYLKQFVRDDGGMYADDSLYKNYESSLGLMAFSEANRSGKYDQICKNLENFIKGIQNDGSEGLESSDEAYGGAGYGKHKRPDLNNTGFLIDALKSAGAGPDDPAMQKALIFVSRCQNLETEHNQTKWAAKNPDGGFYYTIAAGGSSQAGETPQGGLRSYGSMTYNGLKSMIYAGVDKDDRRVKAAYGWIEKHYTLDSNPGMGQQGLYYYYTTFAKALDALDVETVTTPEGEQHNWRAELVAKLKETQKPDGSWINEADRWLEGDPNLVTGYVLLALDHTDDD